MRRRKRGEDTGLLREKAFENDRLVSLFPKEKEEKGETGSHVLKISK